MTLLSLPEVAALVPGPAADLDRVIEVCRESVSPEDFALCLLRIARLHGCDGVEAEASSLDPTLRADLDRWWQSHRFDARQRALLGFVEQFVFDVSSMSDEHVDALLATDDPLHVHQLANLAWMLDLVLRVRAVSAKVLP